MTGIADKIKQIRDRAGDAVNALGQTGAFGLAGSAIGHLADRQMGRKITELQTVYDTYGSDATAHLLASKALQSTLKRLPGPARIALRSGAAKMHQASPLIRGVLRLADIARKV